MTSNHPNQTNFVNTRSSCVFISQSNQRHHVAGMKDGYGWDHILGWRSDFVYFLRQGCLEVQSLYEERGNTMCGLPTSPPTHTMVPHTS
ncbi:hypothetical protein MCOR02_007540 [Pyricularia oryzae]|nr:hypothetical protein MCOR02_007540 [Pyricularia oryzae]KAI6577723.1 hypothetical protein MCOR04_006637 [Pyricularia oryzae]